MFQNWELRKYPWSLDWEKRVQMNPETFSVQSETIADKKGKETTALIIKKYILKT